jgi:hypothetical protein
VAQGSGATPMSRKGGETWGTPVHLSLPEAIPNHAHSLRQRATGGARVSSAYSHVSQKRRDMGHPSPSFTSGGHPESRALSTPTSDRRLAQVSGPNSHVSQKRRDMGHPISASSTRPSTMSNVTGLVGPKGQGRIPCLVKRGDTGYPGLYNSCYEKVQDGSR